MPRTESYDDYLIKVLKDKDEAVGYLNAALEEDDPRIFLLALRNVTLAQGGVGRLASHSGLNRESLYRMLSEKGNPSMGSLNALFGALGLRLTICQRKHQSAGKVAERAPLGYFTVLSRVGGVLSWKQSKPRNSSPATTSSLLAAA